MVWKPPLRSLTNGRILEAFLEANLRGVKSTFLKLQVAPNLHDIPERFVANVSMKVVIVFRGKNLFQLGTMLPPPSKKTLKNPWIILTSTAYRNRLRYFSHCSQAGRELRATRRPPNNCK